MVNKLRQTNKAYLFTFTLVTLAFTVLSIAVLAERISDNSQQIFSDIIVFDRMYDLDSSANKIINTLIADYSGITITQNDHSIVFEEQFPNPFSENFDALGVLFADFVNTNQSDFLINISSFSDLPFILKTVGLNKTYDKDLRTIYINSETVPERYSLSITSLENLSCSWAISPGSVRLDFTAIATKETGCTSIVDINPEGITTLVVQSDENPSNTINIKVEDYELTIAASAASVLVAEVSSEIFFNQTVGPLYFGNNTIISNFSEFGITKRSGTLVGSLS